MHRQDFVGISFVFGLNLTKHENNTHNSQWEKCASLSTDVFFSGIARFSERKAKSLRRKKKVSYPKINISE